MPIEDEKRIPGLKIRLRNHLRSAGYRGAIKIKLHKRYGIIIKGDASLPDIRRFDEFNVVVKKCL